MSRQCGPVARLDGRTQTARRLRRIEADLMTGLEPSAFVDDAARALVRHAAELALAAEVSRRRLLRGEPLPIPDVVKLENCAARAARAVRAHAVAKRARPDLPSFSELFQGARK
jgi:hypothetical protein